MRRLLRTGLLIACAFGGARCSGGSGSGDPANSGPPSAADSARAPAVAVGSVTDLEVPAGSGSMSANLALDTDGRLVAIWIEPAPSAGHTLKFAAYGGSAWSEPRTIATGRDWFVTHADIPAIVALSDGTLVASWLANHVPGTEAANIFLSRSRDRGETWSAPVIPHRDRSVTQHGFLSLVAGAGGALEAIWLDGRHTAAGAHGHGGNMALVHATMAADGTIGAETEIDSRVCDCCPTSAVATKNGVVAVYRDRTDQEIRDISIARFANGRWSSPEPVTHDEWQIHACPVNGPAISANGGDVAVAWFTAAKDEARVQVKLSRDGGKTFGPPVRIDASRPAGRVDVVSLDGSGALVSWVERADHGLEARVRQVDAKGIAGTPVSASGGAAVVGSAQPRLQTFPDGIALAWTEAGKPTRVKVVRIK